MIKLITKVKVGKVPDYNGKQFGKLQVSNQKLAEQVGKQIHIIVLAFEINNPEEENRMHKIYNDLVE